MWLFMLSQFECHFNSSTRKENSYDEQYACGGEECNNKFTDFNSFSSPAKTIMMMTSRKSLKCQPLVDPDVAAPNLICNDDDDESSSSLPQPPKTAKTMTNVSTKTTTTTANGAAMVDAPTALDDRNCAWQAHHYGHSSSKCIHVNLQDDDGLADQVICCGSSRPLHHHHPLCPPMWDDKPSSPTPTKKNVASKATVATKERVKNKLLDKLHKLKLPPSEVVASQPKNNSMVSDGHLLSLHGDNYDDDAGNQVATAALQMVVMAAVADDEAIFSNVNQ